MMVLLTAAAGFVLGSGDRIDWIVGACALVGTMMAAGSANALNQWWEMARDGRMPRTQHRPLPAGRIGRVHAVAWSLVVGAMGVGLLALTVNALTAALALATIAIYLFIYTPLKTRSTLNTLVGAVCGAIPPMIGWAAATGRLDAGAWLLGIILFIWQIPHFMALAWLYRRDYRLGGFRMLPAVDPTGEVTGRLVVLYGLALLPIGLAAMVIGMTGYVYAIGSLVLGAGLLSVCWHLYRRRTDLSARRLFVASLIYLPLVMLLMLIDRGSQIGTANTAFTQLVILAPGG
jgi:protoheme IX farnesyltransferase